ncbi:MAG: carboxypeptidase regulatory-like domain-containing protein [Gemmatimonadales bacterium]
MSVAGFAPAVAFSLAVGVGGAVPLQAQQAGSVRGVVLDAITRTPLQHVAVVIVGRLDSALTDDAGAYRIDAVAPGQVRLTARKLGFHPITTAFYTVAAGGVVMADFALAPLAVDLAAVEVEAEPSRRRAAIGAQVLKGEDLPRGDILTALQSAVPSLRMSGRRDDMRMRMRQSSSEVLYVIDGTVITPPLTFLIDTRDVACVEVRPGYRAAQEFRPSINSEAYSGVVLIWTRASRAPRPRECAQP